MTCLILINGLPASRKSTLARRCAADHSLTLALDIDVVRGLFGNWLTDMRAKMLARGMALEMARIALSYGHDVVVPQLLSRAAFVRELDAVAADVGVPFVEIVLVIPAGTEVDRFKQRTDAPATATDLDNARLQNMRGGPEALPGAAAAVRRVVAERPGTDTIVTRDGEVDTAYAELLAFVRSRTGPYA